MTALGVSIRKCFAALALSLLTVGAHGASAASQPKPAAAYPFTFEILQQTAERLAAKPHAPQRSSLPAILDKLSPEQYRSFHHHARYFAG